ncbi:chromosome partition protein MukE [bacterium]|nr:chromosome partition protein MukE [bacterium]
MDQEINDLHDLLLDPIFPDLDIKLRSGWHCDEEEIEAFDFITKTQDKIEMFYELYGFELLYATEGYYYLRPVSSKIKVRTLGMEAMIISQFLALMKMDPQYLESTGFFDLQELMDKIELTLGKKQVSQLFLKRKKYKEAISEQDALNFQLSVKKALRELARYGFISINPDFTKIYPRKPIFRFMDPIRNMDNPRAALESIVRGENPFESNDESEEDDD